MSNVQTYVVQFLKHRIEPDRFGRLHSVIKVNPFLHNNFRIDTIHLNTIDEGFSVVHTEGTDIEIEMVGNCPLLSHTTQNKSRGITAECIYDYCYSCNRYLVARQNGLYCPNDNCLRTTVARLTHATRYTVLDLPITNSLLTHSVFERKVVVDLPSLLNLDISDTDKFYAKHESEYIISALQLRLESLYRHTNSSEEHSVTQGKFLDALSVAGLYNRNRLQLHDRLHNQAWAWSNLAEVLTDIGFLVQSGIDRSDARIIVQHAENRIHELDTLAREF